MNVTSADVKLNHKIKSSSRKKLTKEETLGIKFLDFNRDIHNNHVKKLESNIKKYGDNRDLIVIKTKAISNQMQLYWGDGQHYQQACLNLGITPTVRILKGFESRRKIGELIADLNNCSKSWGLHNYLNLWTKLEIPSYVNLHTYKTTVKMPLSILIWICSNNVDNDEAIEMFKEGKYVMAHRERINKELRYYEDIKKVLKTKAYAPFIRAWVQFIRTQHYDHSSFLKKVSAAANNNSKWLHAPTLDVYSHMLKMMK